MNVNQLARLKIGNGRDRAEIVSILADAGYIVEVEIKKEDFPIDETYFVNVYEREKSEE